MSKITLSEMAHLSVLYAQKHRHYHDITHILACLTELEQYAEAVELHSWEFNVIEKAIWFHDAVYNPYSKLNERNSADLLSPDDLLTRWIIYTTAHHTETQTFGWAEDDREEMCAKVMLDIDLAGFGKPWANGYIQALNEYGHNSENIRKEYYKTGPGEFDIGRYQFLKTIAKRPTLYYTEYFYNKYHVQSQLNIALDITRLEQENRQNEAFQEMVKTWK